MSTASRAAEEALKNSPYLDYGGVKVAKDWLFARNPLAGIAGKSKLIAFNPNDPTQKVNIGDANSASAQQLMNYLTLDQRKGEVQYTGLSKYFSDFDPSGNAASGGIRGSVEKYFGDSMEDIAEQKRLAELTKQVQAGQITAEQATAQARQKSAPDSTLYEQTYNAAKANQTTPASGYGAFEHPSPAEAYRLRNPQKAVRQPGESIAGFTSRLGGGAGSPSSVVGTSAALRLKEIQKALGVGAAPQMPDLFTNADQKTLNTARTERNAIDTELASILDERLKIDEEMQKFKANAGEGTTEAGRIGAVSEAERNVNERLMVLNRRELVLETKLRNRNTVISELQQNQRLDYANAVEQYDKSYTRALQLYAIFDEEQDEARAEAKEAKNELKTNAKANLDVLSNSLKAQIEAGTLASISGVQQAKIEELETQAGLPAGSTLAVLQTLKPGEEKLYAGVDDYGNFVYISRDAQGQINVKKAAGAVPQRPPKPDEKSTLGADLNDAFLAIQSGADPMAVKRAFLVDHPSSGASWDSYFENTKEEVEYPEPEKVKEEKGGLFGWGFLGL